MKFLCRLLGHKLKTLFPMTINMEIGDPVYTSLSGAYRSVFFVCDRCGEKIQTGEVRDEVMSGLDGRGFYESCHKEPGQ